jgi:hypothetical protein
MKRATRRLQLEPLEDRNLLATFGIPWPDAQHLTLSFVPDGTSVSGSPSKLSALLNSTGPSVNWQTQVLRAFQGWAASANINIGLVSDDGEALGTSGLIQHDPRFGDIRIAAAPMAGGAEPAVGTPFDYSGSRWNGTVVLNSLDSFTIGNNPNAGYDIFSVLAHEAGHVFGLDHNTTDPNSVIAPTYAFRTGLSASDVTNIQSLYGPRLADGYEGSAGNNTLGSAYDLGQSTGTNGAADVTNPGETDYYKFTAPTGATSLTVTVQTSGISLLVPRLTIYDGTGKVIGTAASTGPLAGDVSFTLPAVQAGASYYAEVQGATNDVFSIGAYQLSLAYQFAPGTGTQAPPMTSRTLTARRVSTAPRTASAVSTNPTPLTGSTAQLSGNGQIATAGAVNYYQFQANFAAGGTPTMTVAVNTTDASGLQPAVTVYDANGNVVPSVVVENEQGMFTVQVINPASGTYQLAVSGQSTGASSTGNYNVTVYLNGAAPIQFALLATDTLTQTSPQEFRTMKVGESGLKEFTLSVSSQDPSIADAVRMIIFDAKGNEVFTMVGFAGAPTDTAVALLGQGTYTVGFYAATKSGAPLPGVNFALGERDISDPIDPYPVPPGSPPPPPPSPGTVTLGNPSPTSPIPLAPVTTNPYAI